MLLVCRKPSSSFWSRREDWLRGGLGEAVGRKSGLMTEAVWGMTSVGVGGRGDSATFWDVGGWLVEDADFLGMDGVLVRSAAEILAPKIWF